MKLVVHMSRCFFLFLFETLASTVKTESVTMIKTTLEKMRRHTRLFVMYKDVL